MIEQIKTAFNMVINYEKMINLEEGYEKKILKSVSETLILKIENLENTKNLDEILNEIITFNEILNYSIKSLKKEPSSKALMYIQMVEEANSLVNTTISNEGIQKISPKEGDIFNNKEHIVIMVQKDEDFTKGKIIKKISDGYRKEDKVIIKATVIAAL